jgi:putative hydrolase of the HAD superfamily
VYPDVFPSLTALKERGITAAIASNWDERLPKLLRELSLAPHFDFQFISSFIGHTKPEAAFFNHALKMMGLEADEVLHVGDDPIDDITGALGVGIKGVLLDRRGDKAAGEVINNLTQLVGLV